MTDEVRRDALLAATPAEVWRALTDPAALSSWFGGDVRIDPRPRGDVVERRPDGTTREGIVISVVPSVRLVIAWSETTTSPASRLEVVLEPEGDGTRMTVTERALQPFEFRAEAAR